MNKIWFLLVMLNLSLTGLIAQDQFKVLLFTQHDEWHSDCIPAAVQAFEELSAKNQFKFDWTQRAEELSEILLDYDVVVFINADSDNLNDSQIQTLKSFMNKGGGFVGIHAASTPKIRNEWYEGLIGGVFTNHPKFQTGILNVVDQDYPATMHLPKKWLWSDEWYNFERIDTNKLNVVLTVDESSYQHIVGKDNTPLKGMDENHPIAWHHKYDGGRVFYTSLGHRPEAYKNTDFLNHILGGIYWTTKNN